MAYSSSRHKVSRGLRWFHASNSSRARVITRPTCLRALFLALQFNKKNKEKTLSVFFPLPLFPSVLLSRLCLVCLFLSLSSPPCYFLFFSLSHSASLSLKVRWIWSLTLEKTPAKNKPVPPQLGWTQQCQRSQQCWHCYWNLHWFAHMWEYLHLCSTDIRLCRRTQNFLVYFCTPHSSPLNSRVLHPGTHCHRDTCVHLAQDCSPVSTDSSRNLQCWRTYHYSRVMQCCTRWYPHTLHCRRPIWIHWGKDTGNCQVCFGTRDCSYLYFWHTHQCQDRCDCQFASHIRRYMSRNSCLPC